MRSKILLQSSAPVSLKKFNEKKMNFGKIGMAVDADADGYNIACLIMVLFDTLMPGLIESGHLYC